MNRSLLRASLLISFVLACLALSPQARATCQEGCLTNENTVLGDDALFSLTTGFSNTAIGFNALYFNTQGVNNTAIGAEALYSNTEGFYNTATGVHALYSNTNGDRNTANGTLAPAFNTTGSHNTATGDGALVSNTTGFFNTASGAEALLYNTTGDNNTADGYAALLHNTTGNFNTSDGVAALFNNTTGNKNIALGYKAGTNLTTGSGNIDIGNGGVAGESRTIRIGSADQTTTFIAGISGATVADGVGVIVGADGHLGTIVSSGRYKDAIKPMDKASEAILALKPVTFRYKRELDSAGIPQFGLVAEEVEKVNPDLVVRDDEGKPYTVRYEAVNAMLLNEFLKEHRKGEQQDRKIEKLEATIAKQQKQIEALTTGLRKVSDQLEVSKSAPQIVRNDQ